jgi:hypothetical protein
MAMTDTKQHKKLLETLHKENMLWLFLGILVSDMTCSDLHQIEASMDMVQALKETIKVEKVELPEDVLGNVSKHLDNAVEILEQSYKELNK